MFRYYLTAIFGGLGSLFLLSWLVGEVLPMDALLGLSTAFAGVFLADAVIAALVRLIPAHRFDPESLLFRVRSGERGKSRNRGGNGRRGSDAPVRRSAHQAKKRPQTPPKDPAGHLIAVCCQQAMKAEKGR